MSFEIFTEHQVQGEVRQMLVALKKADYAVSDLSKEQIEKSARHFDIAIKLRKLKDGRIKIQLTPPTNNLKEGKDE